MDNKLLVVATETGGSNPYKHSILSLAAMVVNIKGTGVARYLDQEEAISFIVKENSWSLSIDEHISKYSIPKIMEIGTDIRDVFEEFSIFLDKHFKQKIILAGHNTKFDIGFLRRFYRKAGSNDQKFDERFFNQSFDIADIALFLKLTGRLFSLKSTSLDNLCKIYLLKEIKEYDSLEKVNLVSKILEKMVSDIKPADYL